MFIETYEAEYIEQKVARITESNEPITDGAQMIYTNAKDGVIKAYDIRTDKWEVAQDAMNSVNKQRSIDASNALKGTPTPRAALDAFFGMYSSVNAFPASS